MDPRSPTFPFDRITVRTKISDGGSRITWTLDEQFQDPLPHTFTLQGSRSTVETASWTNIGLAATNVDFLVDDNDRLLGDEADFQYRIKVVTPAGTYYSPAVASNSVLSFRDWRLSRDMVRKERLLHSHYVSLAGWLLKRRRSGTKCSLCLDPAGAPDDGRCPECFGTTFEGGYYEPEFCFLQLAIDQSFIDTDMTTGTTQQTPSTQNARMLGDPLPQTRDIFVDGKTDRRYHIDKITNAAYVRSQPIIVTLEVREMGFGDIVYDVPVPDSLPEVDRDGLNPEYP